MIRRFAFVLMSLCAVAASAQTVLKPGDVVTVKCSEDDTLNGHYTITETGLILLQYIGAVEVKGLTEGGAASKISKALVSQQILRKATITLSIKGRNQLPVTVTGAVKKPGDIPWSEGLTLSSVLAKAEPTSVADLTAIRVTRGTQTISTPVDSLLQPGDKVFVPLQVGGREVTVIGAVRKPGAYLFKQGMRLSDAIAAAGGLRSDANRDKVEIRWAIGGRQVVTLDGTDELLSAGDEIVVPLAETKERVYVRGAIAKPGLISFVPGLTAAKAVAEASPIERAKIDGVKVIRKTADGKSHTYKVNLKKVADGREQDWPLMPGDVVDVPYPGSSYSADSSMKVLTVGLILFFLFRG